MIEVGSENKLNLLSSRAGFNLALRHFKRVLAISADVNEGRNLADLLNEALDESEIQENQIRPIINSLLIQKFNYSYKSHNMIDSVSLTDKSIEILNQWTAIEFVVLYYNPSSGISVINPKNKASIDAVQPLVRDELIVCYAGAADEEISDTVLESAIEDFYKILYEVDVSIRDDYKSKTIEQKVEPVPQVVETPVPSEDKPSGKRRVTTKYGVQVTNEVFHNGNVEAWKKIIDSYTTTYPGTEILVWYEDEKINDINALFKWGKVKHGCPIMFSVAGEEIKDVSKLKRYLFEGASSRFEVFLRGAVGSVLDLF